MSEATGVRFGRGALPTVVGGAAIVSIRYRTRA